MILPILYGLLSYVTIGPLTLGEVLFISEGIFKIIKKKKIYINRNLLVYSICTILFLFYTIIYYFMTPVIYIKIYKNIFKYFCIFLMVIIFYQKVHKNRKEFYKYILIFSISMFISKSIFQGGISIFDAHFLHYSYFGLIFILLLQFEILKKNYKILMVFSIIVSIYAYSRGNLLVLLSVFFMNLLNNLLQKKKTMKNIVIKSVSITILFISAIGFIIYFLISLQEPSASNMERADLIESAILAFKIHPIIGVGPGNFNDYVNNTFGYFFPLDMSVHNYFLEILCEWGIIGFILIIIPYINMGVQFLKNKCRMNMEENLFIYLFIFIFFNVVAGNFRIIFSFLLAASLNIGSNISEVTENE